MPYEFTIDSQKNLIRETWTGRVDLVQMKESSEREWAHPDYRKDMDMIVDFRQARMELTADEVWAFAVWFSERESLSKFAVVVAREAAYGMVRMFQSVNAAHSAGRSANDNARVFYSLEAAENWVAETPSVK